MNTALKVLFVFLTVFLLFPANVLAYGGPGSVISGIGALIAAIGALLAAIVGFVWYPLKRLYRTLFAEEQEASVKTADE